MKNLGSERNVWVVRVRGARTTKGLRIVCKQKRLDMLRSVPLLRLQKYGPSEGESFGILYPNTKEMHSIAMQHSNA